MEETRVEDRSSDEPAPAAVVPWLQGLALVLAFGTGALQAFLPEFDPPKELYYLFGAAAVGLDREYSVRLIKALRGK